jgi:hypothetical protein
LPHPLQGSEDGLKDFTNEMTLELIRLAFGGTPIFNEWFFQAGE